MHIILFVCIFRYIVHGMSCCCNLSCCVRVAALMKCCVREGVRERFSHLSESRDSLHCVTIDREWSSYDTMLVHAFHSLQGTVPVQSIFWGRSTATPYVSKNLNDCANLSVPLYDSFLPHAASLTSRFACQPRFSFLVRMLHPARRPGHWTSL